MLFMVFEKLCSNLGQAQCNLSYSGGPQIQGKLDPILSLLKIKGTQDVAQGSSFPSTKNVI